MLYTVPAGRTAVVRSIAVVNTASSGTGDATFYVNGSSSADIVARLTLVAPAGGEVPLTDMVLNPGDQLWGKWNLGSSSCRVTAFGSLLLGAPE